MDYNVKVHYYLKNCKTKLKGEIPVYLRLTLNGQRIEISTGQSIIPENWNKYSERAKGNKEEARVLNNYLDTLTIKVKKCYNDLLSTGDHFDINDLRYSLSGKDKIRKTLIQVHNENNILMKKEEGIKYVKRIVSRYFASVERLQRFLKEEYHTQDMPLEKLNYQFMQRYEVFH